VIVRGPGGKLLGITPKAGVSPASAGSLVAPNAAKRTSSNGNLDYHGGPVLHLSAAYLIFWDPNGVVTPTSRSLLQQYLTDTATDSGHGTNIYAVDRQFTDTSGFSDYKQLFSPGSQVIVDTNAFPARDTVGCPDVDPVHYPNCLTDQQLQTELSAQISAKSLPTGTGPNAPIYFLVTPSDTNICTSATACNDNAFCAYHSFMTSPDVLYSSIPLFFNGASSTQNPKLCQADGHSAVQKPNGDLADVAIKFLSHEHSETITDPIPGAGWWDNSSGNEDGDNCNFFGSFNPHGGSNPNAFNPTLGGSSAGTLYNQVINGHHYYIQSEWSNGDVDCEMKPTAGSLSPTFLGPGVITPNQPASFNPTASTSSRGYSSTTWDFGDGSSAFNVGGPSVTSHAFSTPGPYTVRLTLVDAVGNVSSVTDTAPDDISSVSLAVNPTSIHAGVPATFDGSGSRDPDGAIRSYQWNFGDGSSATGPGSQHIYRRKGSYTVVLTVTDSGGQTSQAIRTVDVAKPKISTKFKHGVLKVSVDQPGSVKVQSKRKRLKQAGTLKFKIKLSRRQRRLLHSRHHLKLKLRITFSPGNADRVTKLVTVKLKG
jgi:PKD domain